MLNHRYLCYWKKRFKEKAVTEFCPVININTKADGESGAFFYAKCSFWLFFNEHGKYKMNEVEFCLCFCGRHWS